MGVGAEAFSAPATRRISRSLSQLPILVLPVLMVVDVRILDLAVGIDNARHARSPYPSTLAACVVRAQLETERCCIEPSGSVTRALTPGNEASSVAPHSGG